MTSELYSVELDIVNGRLYHALLSMQQIVVKLSDYNLRDRLLTLEQNYRYLLDYFIQGGDDPQRSAVLQDLSRSALKLLDDVFLASFKPNGLYVQMVNKAQAYRSDGTKEGDFKQQFYQIWLGKDDNPDTDDNVSALLIRLLHSFSQVHLLRILALVRSEDMLVQAQAQTAFVLLMQRYEQRLVFYPEIQKEITNILSDKTQREALREVCHALLNTALTPAASREMKSLQDELMPQIDKGSRQVIIAMEEADEDNPEWKDGISKVMSKHADRVQQLHQQGADIAFASTSGVMNYGFFHNDIANWFLPFDSNNKEIDIDFTSPSGKLLKGMILSHDDYCDIDKYALCCIFKRASGEMFDKTIPSMIKELGEIGDFEDKNEPLQRKQLIVGYVRNLYRFFMLNPWGIPNIMDSAIDIGQTDIFGKIFTLKQQMKFADRCMTLECYKQAEKLYASFDDSAEVLQKLGLSQQRQELYDMAAVTYDNALALKEDIWTLSHLATCLRRLNQKPKALRVYNRILALDSTRKSALQQKAQILLDLGRQDEAMQVFFKLEALFPDDINTARGMGWCALLLGNYPTAEKYLETMAYSEDATANDLINYGHLLLLTNHLKEALHTYLSARPLLEKNSQLLNLVRADRPMLIQKGLKIDLLTLVDEALLLQLKQKKN